MASELSPGALVPLPITGELDLQTLLTGGLGELIPADRAECGALGLRDVRSVHGEGTGTLRTTVHALLQRSPHVQTHRLGDAHAGSWGATVVKLRR